MGAETTGGVPAQFPGRSRHGGRPLVLHDEPGGSRPLGEDAVECLGGALVRALAGAVQEAQAALSGPLGELCEGAFGVPGVPFVDPGSRSR